MAYKRLYQIRPSAPRRGVGRMALGNRHFTLGETAMATVDRSLSLSGWAILALLLLTWALPVSRLAYEPIQVDIIGDEVILQRNFPGDRLGLPRPILSFTETVTPLTQTHNGGHVCEMAGGPFRYSRADEVGQWAISWAADCLNDPQGFRWSAQWRWHLGAIQFGPVSKSKTVLRDPCQYRISSTGRIHGPDSPHQQQVSRGRCFPTREQAEQYITGD